MKKGGVVARMRWLAGSRRSLQSIKDVTSILYPKSLKIMVDGCIPDADRQDPFSASIGHITS